MKKTIIIIALAILMVVSVFADTTKDTKNTTVILTLERDPTYKVAITKTPLDTTSSPSTVTKDTDLSHVSEINLEYTKDTLKFAQNTSDTFYLSFLFYDYADVKLGMKIDGPLTREDVTTETDDDKIYYKVTVETGSDNKSVSITGFELTANGTKEKADIVTYQDTKKMGEIRYASLKLTVGPTSDDQTVEGKIVGTYKSTITITATTTA